MLSYSFSQALLSLCIYEFETLTIHGIALFLRRHEFISHHKASVCISFQREDNEGAQVNETDETPPQNKILKEQVAFNFLTPQFTPG